MDELKRLLNPFTRIVAVAHVSNALGTVNPVREIVRLAHAHGAAVLIDGAQAVSHLRVDVRELDCDFYVLSGHKVYGPTGIGVLYGKPPHLELMPPYQTGGVTNSHGGFWETHGKELSPKISARPPPPTRAVGAAGRPEDTAPLGRRAARRGAH